MSSIEKVNDAEQSTSETTSTVATSSTDKVIIIDSQHQNTSEADEVDPNADTPEVAEKKYSATLEEYIRLRVITADMSNEVHFRVKAATSLLRLKRSYCNKMGFQVNELRFVFDGHRITDMDTPKSLGMINDDVIEIYQERIGGM
jgi:small ubiquitin-related modifier